MASLNSKNANLQESSFSKPKNIEIVNDSHTLSDKNTNRDVIDGVFTVEINTIASGKNLEIVTYTAAGSKKNGSIFAASKDPKMDGEVYFSIPRRSYGTVGILFLINLLNYMDRFTIAGVLKKVKSDFNMDDAQSGLLQTMFICAYMIFAPIFGYLGDRYSRKWIMVAGISIWSLTVLLSTFIPSNLFWVFLICRGVVGIGEASYSTVASTLIADLFTKDKRSRMLMVFYFAIPVGSGLGYMVGSGVAGIFPDPHVGWRWGVRVTPMFGLICLLLLIFVVKEPKRGEVEQATKVQTSTWTADLVYLIKNRSFVWTTLGFTCVAFASGCLSWWTPTFIIRAEEMMLMKPDEATIGLIFGVITCLAGFVGVTIGSVASQIWRRTNPRADPLVCGIGILLSVPFMYFGLTVTQYNMPAAWVCVFFAVMCLSLNWAIVSDVLMYIVTPSRRSTASAFQILFSHLLGDAASPYLVGLVSDAIRGESSSAASQFFALKYAMYIPDFILVVGGFFFLGTAWYVEADRKKSEMLAKGLAPGQIATVEGLSQISDHSGSYGGIGETVGGEIASADSRAYLIAPDDEQESPVRYRL